MTGWESPLEIPLNYLKILGSGLLGTVLTEPRVEKTLKKLMGHK